jgi:hypothetical protein
MPLRITHTALFLILIHASCAYMHYMCYIYVLSLSLSTPTPCILYISCIDILYLYIDKVMQLFLFLPFLLSWCI